MTKAPQIKNEKVLKIKLSSLETAAKAFSPAAIEKTKSAAQEMDA